MTKAARCGLGFLVLLCCLVHSNGPASADPSTTLFQVLDEVTFQDRATWTSPELAVPVNQSVVCTVKLQLDLGELPAEQSLTVSMSLGGSACYQATLSPADTRGERTLDELTVLDGHRTIPVSSDWLEIDARNVAQRRAYVGHLPVTLDIECDSCRPRGVALRGTGVSLEAVTAEELNLRVDSASVNRLSGTLGIRYTLNNLGNSGGAEVSLIAQLISPATGEVVRTLHGGEFQAPPGATRGLLKGKVPGDGGQWDLLVRAEGALNEPEDLRLLAVAPSRPGLLLLSLGCVMMGLYCALEIRRRRDRLARVVLATLCALSGGIAIAGTLQYSVTDASVATRATSTNLPASAETPKFPATEVSGLEQAGADDPRFRRIVAGAYRSQLRENVKNEITWEVRALDRTTCVLVTLRKQDRSITNVSKCEE